MKRFFAIIALLTVAITANAGRIVTDSLYSNILKASVKYNVYLPDGFNESGKTYPVVYLLHGLYGTYQDWEQKGTMKEVADELIRSGIQGVDKGQWEACETLGISYGTMMKEIILPQAFKQIVPPMVSEFIMLIKDSSLISNIGALELLYAAQVLGKKYYDYLDPLIIAAVMYLTLTILVSWLSKKLERRLAVSD